MNNRFCCQCGAPRPLTRPPTPSFSLHDVKNMRDLREIARRPENEVNPQVILLVQVYRNGGTDPNTHICDDCLRVSLTEIRTRIDDVLASLA